ncbi:hypothetical protein E2C01_045525 [Portunus trituberculatus]|uniref:Uncharacterized protein n=1 Tax=Portunus trituberculatus TaxID=210409 RepID=A0A5B7G343_PORTR|nr:hypothetical protein [Portunus trituberculatus]
MCGSDHALNIDKTAFASSKELLARWEQLGTSYYHQPVRHKLQRSVCLSQVDMEKMAYELRTYAPPDVSGVINVDIALTAECNIYHRTCT